MCADNFKKSEDYTRTRDSFDDLGVEEQAVFIVESAVNMIVKSVQKAGDAFSKAFDEMKVDVDGEREDDAEDEAQKPKKKKAPATKKTASKSTKSKASSKKKTDE